MCQTHRMHRHLLRQLRSKRLCLRVACLLLRTTVRQLLTELLCKLSSERCMSQSRTCKRCCSYQVCLSRHHRCQLRMRTKLCRMCWCTASQLLRRRLHQPSVQLVLQVSVAASAEVDAYAVQANDRCDRQMCRRQQSRSLASVHRSQQIQSSPCQLLQKQMLLR